MLPRLILNAWAQGILLPQPPINYIHLKAISRDVFSTKKHRGECGGEVVSGDLLVQKMWKTSFPSLKYLLLLGS